LSFGTFSAITVASLIPALVTLSSVLAPVVAAFTTLAGGAGALAGAFGTIIGSGLLAYGKELVPVYQKQLKQVESQISALKELKKQQGGLTQQQFTRLQQLKEEKTRLNGTTSAVGALQAKFSELAGEISQVIIPFGMQFVPLIKEAVNALPDLVEKMLGAVGGTSELTSTLRELGGIAMEVLPSLFGAMFDFATKAAPVFMDFVRWLTANGPGAFESMVSVTKRLAPVFRNLLDSVIKFAPVFLEFGTNVASVVIPAVSRLIEWLRRGMQWVNSLKGTFQDVAVTLLALSPAVVWLAQAFGGQLVGALIGAVTQLGLAGAAIAALTNPITWVVAAVAGLAAMWATNFGNIRGHTMDAVGQIQTILKANLGPALEAIEGILHNVYLAFKFVWGMIRPIVEPAVSFLIDAVGTQLVQTFDIAISTITALLQLMNGDVKGALTTMEGLFARTLTRLTGFFDDWTNGGFSDFVNGIIEGVNFLGGKLEEFAKLLGDDFRFKELGSFNAEKIATDLTRPAPGSVEDRRQEQRQRLEIFVTSDDEKFQAYVKDGARDVVRSQAERAGRFGVQ
jgi:hypothetical protein